MFKQLLPYYPVLKLKTIVKLFLACSSIANLPSGNLSAAVLTSIRPLGFIASALLAEIDEVEVLVPMDRSPHDYVPSVSQLNKLKSASCCFWIGPGLETAMSKSLIAHAPSNRLCSLGHLDSLKPYLREQSHSCSHCLKKDTDWHIWLSPDIAAVLACAMAKSLEVAYQNCQAQIEKNLANFLQEVKQKSLEIKQQFHTTPAKNYAVFHDSCGYFAEYFQLPQAYVVALRAGIPMSAYQWTTACSNLREQQITVLFIEPSDPKQLANHLAKRIANLRVVELDPLGSHLPLHPNSYCKLLGSLADTIARSGDAI